MVIKMSWQCIVCKNFKTVSKRKMRYHVVKVHKIKNPNKIKGTSPITEFVAKCKVGYEHDVNESNMQNTGS